MKNKGSVLLFCLYFVFGVMSPMACVYGSSASLPESVVVTAGKREGIAEDLPASINIQDPAFMEDFGITNTREMTRLVPNVFYKRSASGDAFVSRGISTLDPSLYSPMGLYVDDTVLPLSYMQEQPLLDVERLEILRGPQSTLYGKNSSSGVINVVMSKPGNTLKSKVFARSASDNTFNGGAMVSGPVKKDILFLGFSVSALRTDGYIENILKGEDTAGEDRSISARGTFLWTPSEKTEISLGLDANDRDRGISYLRYETGNFATSPYKIYSNMEDTADQESFGQSVKVKYRLPEADFLSITSHRRFNRLHKMDLDRTPVNLGYSDIDIEDDNWTQELRLNSKGKREFSWLIGLYASKESQENFWSLNHISPMVAHQRTSDLTFKEAAVFGQGTLSLTEKIDITAGLRVDRSWLKGEQIYTSYNGEIVFENNPSDTKILPMAALSYKISEEIKAYAVFSTGWLAGGYDCYTAISSENFAYDPEYTENYEIGLKTTFFDNRLKANLSIFYTKIDDKQIKEEVPMEGFVTWKITNAAEAHTKGAELDVRLIACEGVEFFAGIGYAGTEIDEWTGFSSGVFVDYSGKHLPWAPDLTASAGIGYYHKSGWYCTTSLFWVGKRYFDAANNLSEDGYLTMDLKSGYRTEHFDISFYGKNLFDTEYLNKKVEMGADLLVEDGIPMSIGGELSWKF